MSDAVVPTYYSNVEDADEASLSSGLVRALGGGGIGAGKGTQGNTTTYEYQGGSAVPVKPMQVNQPQRAVNWTHTVVIPAGQTGIPQALPPLRVPSGCSVTVRPGNGSSAANTKPVYVAKYREALVNNGGMGLQPTDAAQGFPVSNLIEGWVSGTAGDGLIIQVSTPYTS
jgi:hypothetical protein